MKLEEPAQRLTVYVGESDRWDGRALYDAIVAKAHELGLAGVTVVRGIEGYGANSRVHTLRLLELSSDLPVILEVVDHAEAIKKLLPFLDETVKEGLVVIEDVQVFLYRHNGAKQRT